MGRFIGERYLGAWDDGSRGIQHGPRQLGRGLCVGKGPGQKQQRDRDERKDPPAYSTELSQVSL
jgi:hypothetical protein